MLLTNKINFRFLFPILALISAAPPPMVDKIELHSLSPIKYNPVSPVHFPPFSPSEPEETEKPPYQTENTTLTVTYYEEYKTRDHQIIIGGNNYSEGNEIKGVELLIDTGDLYDIMVTYSCEVKKETEDATNPTKCEATFLFEGPLLRLRYIANTKISNGDKLIINFKYNRKKDSKEILFKEEPVIIPFVNEALFCNYKYILPDDYIGLGSELNFLKQESDTIYTFYGDCSPNFIPDTTSNADDDIYAVPDTIRYSPKQSYWKADMEISLQNSNKFVNDVELIFPRYYKGGKIINAYYNISSLDDNESYEEDKIINEDKKLKVQIPSANKEKVGVKLKTSFVNKIRDKFETYFPESYYEIDLSKIDQEIIDKTQEIINGDSNKPNYHKIGYYIFRNIVYDSSYLGRELTLKEIYEEKKGVSEHFTLLYNAMLNSIGIKTLYITGWAFSKDQISGDNDNTRHTWTAALINGRWIELDATWGLFEGVPTGHIIKNIGFDNCYYDWNGKNDDDESSLEKIANIEMITDENQIKELFKNDINEETEIISETSNDISEEINNDSDIRSINSDIISDINDEENNNNNKNSDNDNEEDTSKKDEENSINKSKDNINNYLSYTVSYWLLLILLIPF